MPTLPFSFPGFAVQQVWCGEASLTITAQAISPTAICPSCQQVSHRIHSYYLRSPQDLPISGQTVHLTLQVRRFRCQNWQCPRRTFAERIPEGLPVHARRTARLEAILDLVAVALSGQAGERLVNQMGMRISADTLLRLAKRSGPTSTRGPRILGVDDFGATRSCMCSCKDSGKILYVKPPGNHKHTGGSQAVNQPEWTPVGWHEATSHARARSLSARQRPSPNRACSDTEPTPSGY